MSAAATPVSARPLAERLAGLVLPVDDLAATRAFYGTVFRDARGEWDVGPARQAFRAPDQILEFVRLEAPSAAAEPAGHQAYRVRRDRLTAIVAELEAAGHPASWWREDHPAEREAAPYVRDPSGNLVQLVPSGSADEPLAHAAVEVNDLEHAETFYVDVLGAVGDYYHGWRMDDYAEAKEWEEGRDPCAPWTRRFDVRYWDKLRVARPNMQLFVRFGAIPLGLILATEHRPEPPEDALRGAPCVLLRTDQPSAAAVERLSRRGVRYQRDGTELSLRDPSGNFVRLGCAS